MFGFESIEGTAGWYYTRYPGFLNLECYQLLEDYSFKKGEFKIRKDSTKNRKRKRKDVVLVESEQRKHQTTVTESESGHGNVTESNLHTEPRIKCTV